MAKVDKRTIEAAYVNELITRYGEAYPTVEQVLSNYLSKNGYSEQEIKKIAEEEAFDTVVQAMRFGDYLSTTEDIMKKYASGEAKTLGEINKFFEHVLAKRYGVREVSVDVYNAIRPALNKLIKMGKVKQEDNPEHEGWYVYSYIG